jgi:hypothetical protein
VLAKDLGKEEGEEEGEEEEEEEEDNGNEDDDGTVDEERGIPPDDKTVPGLSLFEFNKSAGISGKGMLLRAASILPLFSKTINGWETTIGCMKLILQMRIKEANKKE